MDSKKFPLRKYLRGDSDLQESRAHSASMACTKAAR